MYIDNTYPFKPISLNYDFSSINQCLGEESMCIHYYTIYQNYINQLNDLLKKYPSFQTWSLDELLFNKNHLPISIQDEVVRLAGGIYNHQVFFSSITDKPTTLNNSPLRVAINKCFGNLNNFFKEFSDKANRVFGSGYLFLACNEQGYLSLITTKDQNTTVSYNLYPLIAIDLWEHSYYLKFTTNKQAYIHNFLSLINWPLINQEYIACGKTMFLS